MSQSNLFKISPLVIYTLIRANPLLAGAVAVTTHHNDFNRTGANLNETVLNTSNVNASAFGKLFSRSVDGQIYAQPLYVPNVSIPGQGVHNVVLVCTEHNSVYAFDADLPAASTPFWQVNLGPPLPASVINSRTNLLHEIGITSTPTIDVASSTIYVVAETYENRVTIFRLHALDVISGAETFNGPTVIQGSVSGTGLGASGGVVPFDPIMQWQRPGLLLWNGNIYIGFGSHQDRTPYRGWIFGYNATTLQQTAIRTLSPNACCSGVWQGGVGLAVDANGFMYVQTGNGQMDANVGGTDYGDSLVKLSIANGLALVDYFTPANHAALAANDGDLGSSGPLLIPGTSLGVSGGKDGKLFVWDRRNLGQFHSTNQVVQWWQATHSLLGTGGGGFFAGHVFYNSTLYVWGRRDTLKAFAFNGSTFNTTPVSQSTFIVHNGYSNEPAMSLSANGAIPGTGILWASFAVNGGASGGNFPGILHAFDASDVSKDLWNSDQNAARDSSGSWAKWSPPTIANGKVYLASFDNVLNVYGLLGSGRSPQITATGGTPQSTAVNSVFATPLQATVKDANNSPVSGTTVTFTAPGAGPSGTFGGSPTATALTNATGVATAATFTANGLTGTYALTATAGGVPGQSGFSLTNTTAGTTGGSLAGSVDTSLAAANLTTEGNADWVHWGDASLNRKAGVSAQISSYTVVGSGAVLKYTTDQRPLSWTDGAPTANSISNTSGIYINGVQNGFSFTAPADTGSRTLTVHVGGWRSSGTLTAHLSDGSAPGFLDTAPFVNASYDRTYMLTYKAGSAGQLLTVTWVMSTGTGNVRMQATALAQP